MVGSSKILTVSYGTFSCTLEGFEDSFSTMKAIAEYFRDLAADDRYFGAEPPSPDAEMLARIAEREVARRVEARTGASGIVLRATSALDAPQPAPDRTGPAHPVAEAEVRVEDPAPVETPPAAAAPRPEPRSMPPRPEIAVPPAVSAERAQPDIDSVAAKLQRIRAVVGRAAGPSGLVDNGEEDETLTAYAPPEPEIVTEVGPGPQSLPEEDAPMVAEPAAEAEEQPEPVSEEAPEPKAPAADEDDLPLLAAVAEETEEQPVQSEPDPGEHAVATEPEDAAGLEVHHAEELQESDVEADPLTWETVEAGPSDELADGADEEDTSEPDPAPLDLGAYLAADETEADADELLADLMMQEAESRLSAAEVQGPLQDEMVEDAEDRDEATDEVAAPVEAARRPAVSARMVRMSRSEYEARYVVAVEEEVETLQTEPAAGVEGSLSPEDEVDLIAELAALEAETDEPMDDDESEVEAEAFWDQAVLADQNDWTNADLASTATTEDDEQADEVEMAEDLPQSRPARPFVEPDADEESLARLMSRAEGEFAAPEAQSRREAITGLKAAVAAAEAARQLGEGKGAADETAFRDDLRQVVRPRRPEVAEARSERPRPAPLKLVAAQRVDIPPQTDEVRQPVRPRRVVNDDAAADAGEDHDELRGLAFASFARDMGASDLSDMLEAAAAYTTFVEGIEDFSRPQLVNKVREIAPDTFSREDELRSFGTLLRQGRIAKVRNGRFQVTEATRFHPERRAG